MQITKSIIKEDSGYDSRKGFYIWHEHAEIKDSSGEKNGKIILSDAAGGCGMQQMYNWVNISDLDYADALIKYMLQNMKHGVGLLICQVGQPYYKGNFVKALENNGFTIMVEYPNYQHGKDGKYTQRVYSYTIKKNI